MVLHLVQRASGGQALVVMNRSTAGETGPGLYIRPHRVVEIERLLVAVVRLEGAISFEFVAAV